MSAFDPRRQDGNNRGRADGETVHATSQFVFGVGLQPSVPTSQMRRFRASADTATLCRSPNTFSERDHQ